MHIYFLNLILNFQYPLDPNATAVIPYTLSLIFMLIFNIVTLTLTLQVHINPERMVPELSFDNNAATCELNYNGYEVIVENCAVGNGVVGHNTG